MPNLLSDWRSLIAERICDFVRDDCVMARFRAECSAFRDEKKRDEEQRAAWTQRRKEHCERGLHTLAEFKARWKETERLGDDRKAIERTRPAEDTEETWVFDNYQDHLFRDELARLRSRSKGPMLVEFRVWVPPKLSLASAPRLTVPELFGRFGLGTLHSGPFGTFVEPGPATLAEEYATLAAIHDALFPDRNPIDDLLYVHRQPASFGKFIHCGGFTGTVGKGTREVMRNHVARLPDSKEPILRAWLADVEHIAAQVRAEHQSSSTGLMDEDTAKEAEQVPLTNPVAVGKAAVGPWEPPPGYVGVKTVMSDKRFQKNDKNPPRTTIQKWVNRANGDPDTSKHVKVVNAPDTGESHYPENWVIERIKTWHPRERKLQA